MLSSAAVLILMNPPLRVSIDLNHNQYPDPLYFIVASLAGWILCYSAAWFIKKTPFKKGMLFLGKRTMCIVIFHYAAFKIVAVAVIQIRHLPAFCLAAFPHLYGDTGLWWLAYTIVGIGSPVLLQVLYEKIKRMSAGFNNSP